MTRLISFVILCSTAIAFISCSENELDVPTTVFTEIASNETGLQFRNDIVETAKVNFYTHQYIYNGGGVGLGDINNDGLSDIYLTSTQGKDKLYINQGNLQFKDISSLAGIDQFPGYKTGVNFIDINQDGYMDIYVCRAGWSNNIEEKKNLLFINNQDNTFSESAKSYGLDDSNHSIQSVFFDYDKDGDLDCYVSNFPPYFNEPMLSLIEKTKTPPMDCSDRLFRNDGGKFTDVSREAGIANYAYGLGIIAADFNNDDWTDIYVTSDFAPRDHYYVNQQDGTFKEVFEESFAHASYFAMGVDMVDINNDESLDLFVGEMLAEENKRQKTNMAPMDLKRFSILSENGMYYQYMRNSFSINNGEGYFSDIAPYSGIDKSDWSWSCLFGDYDHDGDDDLLVANGWLKDTQDKDFNKKTNELAKKSNNQLNFQTVSDILTTTKLKNVAFKNLGNLRFEKASDAWGFDFKGYSHGMASADLDNDGDLDIVVNNNNDLVSLYRNNTNNKNFAAFILEGPKGNKNGLNTKLTLFSEGKKYYKEYQNVRGFQSCVDHKVHVGLPSRATIDSINILWSDNKFQSVKSLASGKIHTIKYNPSKKHNTAETPRFFEAQEQALFVHNEKIYNDYDDQILIPHKMSQLGPALAIGDINADGLDDFFVGGSHGEASALYAQNQDGSFRSLSISSFQNDKKYEDVEAIFFDYNGDGLLDLYVGSGSSEFAKTPTWNQDRVYKNMGNDVFKKVDILPAMNNVTGSVSAHDFDKDGDLDLFVGSRLIPAKYPSPASSYLLQNDNGKFTDVSSKIAPLLDKIGMINSSIWANIDQDSEAELILIGEWTDLQYLDFQDGTSTLKTIMDKKYVGWWNDILMEDIDGDGYDDILVGNLGENYKYQATEEEPFEIFSDDMDGNGTHDIVLGYHDNGKLYPVRGLQCSSEQIPDVKKNFPKYSDFGEADVFKVYGASLENTLHYKANTFKSYILWGSEEGRFEAQALPYSCQLFPIQKFQVADINNDGKNEIIMAGNWYVAEVETPRADAGIGMILSYEGNREFKEIPYQKSGFLANKDCRSIGFLKSKDAQKLIIANNNARLQSYNLRKN